VDEIRGMRMCDTNDNPHVVEPFVDQIQGILLDIGYPPGPSSRLLDFGCGSGAMVYVWRTRGVAARGADVDACQDLMAARLVAEGLAAPGECVFASIPSEPYRLPFEDASFDIVTSWQVFEHVIHWPSALREIARVLKSGGCALHIYPGRYRPLEGHVYVPAASLVRAHAWLALWARLGIRNEFQHGMGWHEVAQSNYEYLTTHTNYPPVARIRHDARKYYSRVSFEEVRFLNHSRGRLRYLYPLVHALPPLGGMVRNLHTSVLCCIK
jgi:SAM-dependent methyltransferase